MIPKHTQVDTVGGAGGTDQHEEYSLGTVEITDGTFNIYVQDADMLGTGYNFFGWAWIRLVPVDEILINCWEDDHQNPVLATTEIVADLVETDGAVDRVPLHCRSRIIRPSWPVLMKKTMACR